MSRIFLSHSREDRCEAAAMSEWLKENGWDDVLFDIDSTPDFPRAEFIEQVIQEKILPCEAVVFLVSQHWLDCEPRRREFDLARKFNKNIICVVIDHLTISELPSCIKGVERKFFLASSDNHRLFRIKPPGADAERQVAFSISALDQLNTELTQARLDPFGFDWPPNGQPDRAPYRGLQPLQAVDAGIFFGREAPLIEALDALRGIAEAAPGRLFVVLGAPGSGKSSFLRAGLWPRLARDQRHFLPLPVIRPAGKAVSGVDGLVAALAKAVESVGLDASPDRIRGAVSGGAVTLRPLLKELARARAPMLVFAIDQAEELFQPEGGGESQSLLTLLGELARTDDPAVIIVFAIRLDCYAALQHTKPFAKLRQHSFALAPLLQYETVIERPLQRLAQAGRKIEIEPTLTQALLQDVNQAGDEALPLLAFALEQLYRVGGHDKPMSWADYEKFGRLAGAIDAAVGRVLAIASVDPGAPKDREGRLALLRRGLIPWFVSIDPETGAARRRIAREAEIPEDARALIALLADERLLTRGLEKGPGQATFELGHDVLLHQWKLLRGWVAAEFRFHAVIDDLKRASRQWEAGARPRAGAAHDGARLEEAEHLYARPDLLALLDSSDRAYLHACREKEKASGKSDAAQRVVAQGELERKTTERLSQHTQRARRLAWFFSCGLAAMIAVAMLAGWQWRAAARAKGVAEAQRNRAEKSLALVSDGANRLVADLTQKLRNASEAQSPVIKDIVTKASKLQDQIVAGGASGDHARRGQSVTLNHIVEARLAIGDVKGAVAAARRSASLMEALSTSSNSGNTGWQRDLSVSYEKLGDALAAQGDLAAALKAYRKDLAIAEKLAASDPRNTQWRWDLSASYENIGDVLAAQGDLAAASKSYRDDLAIREPLAGSEPDNIDWRRGLAVTYERMGATLARQDDVKGAITAFERALGIYQTLARAHPGDNQYLLLTIAPHWRLAELDKARAREHIDAALAILEPLDAAGRLDERRRQWLATIRAGRTTLAASKPVADAPVEHKE